MERKDFVGASDVSSILGLNPFCTPLKLYGLKTGEIPPDDLSNNESVEWGQRLERIVSDKFAEKNNVKLMAYKKRFVHPEMPFFSCELDNIIVGTDELVEVKTVNAWDMKKLKEPDQIPAHFIVQVMAQLGLSKRKIGHIAILVGGQRYLEKKVEFDQEFYNDICSKVAAFWKLVQEKTPPNAMADDADTLLSLYPKNNEHIELVEDLNTAIARRQELSMHIKNMEDEQAEVENQIKQVIGENLGIKTSEYVVTWKAQTRRTVDTVALKADFLYDRYSKESSTRVMRVALNKGV